VSADVPGKMPGTAGETPALPGNCALEVDISIAPVAVCVSLRLIRYER
jgi:hypothetical protein